MRGSLATVKFLKQEKNWHTKAAEGRAVLLEHRAEEAEWVKTRVYSMSYRLSEQLNGFPSEIHFKQGKFRFVISKFALALDRLFEKDFVMQTFYYLQHLQRR